MPSDNWHFTHGNERLGPVPFAELQAMARRQEIMEGDLVWNEGMPQWQRAGDVPALLSTSAPTTAGSAAVMARLAAPVAYYTSAQGLPPRAVANLRGHAPPAGDVGDWPLDDARMADFQEAVRLRKKVTAAAQLYRLLLLLGVIGATFSIISTMAMVGSPRSRTQFIMIAPALVMVALCFLYYFTYRATMRSHRWAPLTMFILFVIGTAVNILALATGGGPNAALNIVLAVIIFIFGGLFALMSWISFANIPSYLAQPAWCQELIVRAGL